MRIVLAGIPFVLCLICACPGLCQESSSVVLSAEKLAKEGDIRSAVVLLESVKPDDPAFARARADLADFYCDAGRADESLEAANDGLAALGQREGATDTELRARLMAIVDRLDPVAPELRELMGEVDAQIAKMRSITPGCLPRLEAVRAVIAEQLHAAVLSEPDAGEDGLAPAFLDGGELRDAKGRLFVTANKKEDVVHIGIPPSLQNAGEYELLFDYASSNNAWGSGFFINTHDGRAFSVTFNGAQSGEKPLEVLWQGGSPITRFSLTPSQTYRVKLVVARDAVRMFINGRYVRVFKPDPAPGVQKRDTIEFRSWWMCVSCTNMSFHARPSATTAPSSQP